MTYRIKTPSGYKSSIRADRHAGHPSINIVWEIGDSKGLRGPISHIPNPRRAISRPRDDEPPVGRERERVDLLGVTLECMANPLLGDIPNLERQTSALC